MGKLIFISMSIVAAMAVIGYAFADQGDVYNPSQIMSKLSDMDESKHEKLAIEDGKLKVVVSEGSDGWFSDNKGPMFYKTVSGDFLLETEVMIKRKDGKAGLPDAKFSSVGLLIRDPASSHGKEKWLMYNIGYQNSFYGYEVKATRPLGKHQNENPYYAFGLHSLSTLFLIPEKKVGLTKLRAARVGNEFRFFYMDDGKWKEVKPKKGTEVLGNGATVPVSQFDKTQIRPNAMNLPDKVQVGIVANPGLDPDNTALKKNVSYALVSYFKVRKISGFDEGLK